MALHSVQLPKEFHYLAPDGSEIRELVRATKGNMAHCRLPSGATTVAVRHKTVEEVWYCLAGTGEVWRKLEGDGEVLEIRPGMSLKIPLGAHFQFRNTGAEPLEILIVSMPPWPGADEAVETDELWQHS